MNLEFRFKNFIKKNNLLHKAEKILLGISGGPDSLTMLNLFYLLKDYYNIEIAAAHLDHSFREESESEAEFVEEFTSERGINFFKKKVNLPEMIKEQSISAEALARKERFSFFEEIIKQDNFDLIALAHHRDDQAETVLLNLFRGSGLKGLSGIKAKSEYNGITIIHPLLEFSKKEILNYCEQKNLKPRFDSSNQENIYSRNVIRNQIFPIVEEKINDQAREVIARNSKLIAGEDEFLNRLSEKEYRSCLLKAEDNKIELDLDKFQEIDQVLQRRIYRIIYRKINNNLDDLYFDHVLEIEKLLKDKSTGRGVDISSGIRVEISYSKLLFFKNNFENNELSNKIKIDLNKTNKFNDKYNIEVKIVSRNKFEFNNDKNRAAFDYHNLQLPLYIRGRKDGDEIIPLGMKGHKKIKDIMIDEKIPKYKRDQIPVIVDDNDNIIWLAPYKMSDEYKITEETDKVLILELEYN